MDKRLERLYEQLGRIDSVIERQTNQRLEKMKEIQQKRDSDAGSSRRELLLRHHPGRSDRGVEAREAQSHRPERGKCGG